MSKEIKLVKKITIKEICEIGREGDIKAFMLEKAKAETELAVIAGYITGHGTAKTNFGESVYLVGSFMAQNRMNGKIVKSSKVYLPRSAAQDAVASFMGRTNATDKIKVELSVSVVEDSSPTGYTYICEPIRTPTTINEEAELMATFTALPAPKVVKQLASSKK